MNRLLFFTIGGMLLFISACSVLKNTKVSTLEDFDTFYEQFHDDLGFQKSRVRFPLEGMKIEGDNHETWNEQNFIPLKTKHFDIDQSVYKVETVKKEKVFVQKVYLENSGFYAEYRFERIEKKWYLVYIMDQNL